MKYKITNNTNTKVSTAMYGDKRLEIKDGKDMIISFTEFKMFEKSLKSLENTGVISIDKVAEEAPKQAEKPVDAPKPVEKPVEAPKPKEEVNKTKSRKRNK